MRKVTLSEPDGLYLSDAKADRLLGCPLQKNTGDGNCCSPFCVGFEIRDRGNKKEVWCNVFTMAIGELVSPTESETDAAKN